MDVEAFKECLGSEKYTDLVRKQRSFVQSLGVRGTPAFVVNGQPISGALPFDMFQQVIEKALAQAEGNPPAAVAEAATATPLPTQAPAAQAADARPGKAVPTQGNTHVQPGQPHPPYNTDPPTSGWHLDNAAPAGFYEEPLLDEALVHNLEHGHIVIAYDCEKLARCDEVKAKLKDLVERYDNWKVTVVPRKNQEAPLALTAWGYIDVLEDYDEARITAFIEAYRDKGPEKTPE